MDEGGLTFHPVLFACKICSRLNHQARICLIYLRTLHKAMLCFLFFFHFDDESINSWKIKAGELGFHRPTSLYFFLSPVKANGLAASGQKQSELKCKLGSHRVRWWLAERTGGRGLEQHLSKMSKYFQILDRFPGVLSFSNCLCKGCRSEIEAAVVAQFWSGGNGGHKRGASKTYKNKYV